jgi:hypothetical protein
MCASSYSCWKTRHDSFAFFTAAVNFPYGNPHKQTVPVSQVTEAAKALPKQTIDKGKVWLYFIGGAVGLFATTIAAENNESWFPAISRANKAMSMSKPPLEVSLSTLSSWLKNVEGYRIPLVSDCSILPFGLSYFQDACTK